MKNTIFLGKNATLQDYLQFIYNGWINGYKSYKVTVIYKDGEKCSYSFPIDEKITFDQLKLNYIIIFDDFDETYTSLKVRLN